MAIVDVSHLSYSYGAIAALRGVDLTIPQGALYALLGPNGSGKTTFLQILMGVRRGYTGSARVLGIESSALTVKHRERIGYIAEGQSLPGWMRLEQLEAYLAPLYPRWDKALARDLRARFDLDRTRKIQTLSRGEYMKAALLCALAPRPELLLMDEPFTGMDALVKDELVRGLLESSGTEGWTVLLCSHDIGELELLADWVGFLGRGRMQIAEPMETLRQRFKQVDVTLGGEHASPALDPMWLSVERSGRQLTFLASDAGEGFDARLAARFPNAARIESRDATLREVFVALARRARDERSMEAAA